MENRIKVVSVKKQKTGWILNGNISVPDVPGNMEREAIMAWIAEGNTPEPQFTDAELLVQAKTDKLEEVTKVYNASISALVGGTDKFELASWTKQEAEARAYMADNSVATPMLSALVAARGLGETVANLAKLVIDKANAYQTAYASILGTYQAKQKAIDAAKTVEEVQAIK
jgi:uncharacterized protein YgiM (DUF1202 family)